MFQMDLDDEMTDVFFSKLLELEREVRRNLSKKTAEDEHYQQHLNEIQ